MLLFEVVQAFGQAQHALFPAGNARHGGNRFANIRQQRHVGVDGEVGHDRERFRREAARNSASRPFGALGDRVVIFLLGAGKEGEDVREHGGFADLAEQGQRASQHRVVHVANEDVEKWRETFGTTGNDLFDHRAVERPDTGVMQRLDEVLRGGRHRDQCAEYCCCGGLSVMSTVFSSSVISKILPNVW